MISLEAYRAAIGQWHPGARMMKRHRENDEDKNFEGTERRVIRFYKNFIVLFIAFVLMPLLLTNLTRAMMRSKQQRTGDDVSLPTPLKVVRLLLIMAGVETDPGPGPTEAKEKNISANTVGGYSKTI